jgi:IS1 family transposase
VVYVALVERESRRVAAHAVCEERTPEVMQAVIDSAPHAPRYFLDAFNPYRELRWWGEHASMYDKSETCSVEGGDNAELRHYLARLTRQSRFFSKCIHARLCVLCGNKLKFIHWLFGGTSRWPCQAREAHDDY